jgi:hypothetical protein
MNKELQDGSVDAGLFLLSLVTPRGQIRTQKEIAEVCGCSDRMIYKIERRALKKLKEQFTERIGANPSF